MCLLQTWSPLLAHLKVGAILMTGMVLLRGRMVHIKLGIILCCDDTEDSGRDFMMDDGFVVFANDVDTKFLL